MASKRKDILGTDEEVAGEHEKKKEDKKEEQ